MTGFARMALLCLYQHRLCSTDQIRRMLTPRARTATYAKRELGSLRRRGLISAIRGPAGQSLWFCTPAGADLVEQAREIPGRDYRMDAARAAGPLQAHTLAVNETGLAFVEAARALGHECGPLDWIPEVAHRVRSGPRGRFDDDHVIPDALLHYVLHDTRNRRRSQLQFFIEVDRATMTVARLAAKVVQYARYYDYVPPSSPASAQQVRRTSQHTGSPAWQSRYPRFPRLLIVLTGADNHHLDRRMLDLAAHLARLPVLHQPRHGFRAGATTLANLHQAGPFHDIVMPLLPPSSNFSPITF